MEVFNIHIWKTTANPLKLLWSSSSDIMKSKATVWDLEDGLSGNDCSTTHHIYSNTAQKHIPETLNHKGKFSTCWNMKGKEAALNRHVRFCLRERKIFLTIKLYNSSKHKSLLGIWSLQLLFFGLFCLGFGVWFFFPKRLKRVNTRFKEMRENKGTGISQKCFCCLLMLA